MYMCVCEENVINNDGLGIEFKYENIIDQQLKEHDLYIRDKKYHSLKNTEYK